MTHAPIVTSSHAGKWRVVRVNGEIDVHTGPALRDHLLSAFAQGEDTIVVDLSEVSFLDSSGLGVLVAAHKRARTTDGELRIAGCRPPVTTLFQITALDRAFCIYPTVEEALAAPHHRPEEPEDPDDRHPDADAP
ncbi:MAG TPA: STAS domain-containing protein [Kineosporiaceae bacterium]